MPRRFRLSSILLIGAAAIITAFTPLRELSADEKGPKIGLVLAGGGALGFAHVGVLKVLEKNNIPVHIITGTSMGSIIGAGYATGAPLKEMENLLISTDWDALFGEKIYRRDLPYRFKPGRDREIYGDGKLSFKDGSIVLPSGAVQGVFVLPLLQRLLEKAPTPANFDDLQIPFRAVTADIETGEAYVPSHGDLATYVRASMSVPGFFAPVDVDGKLLVDGGIVDNTPVGVALEMGADILIVVELFGDFMKRDALAKSPLAITGQIVSILLSQNSTLQRKLMREKDILVAPDLKGYSATDFPKGAELMALGKTAAEKMLPRLEKLAISPEAFEQYQANRQRSLVDPTDIEFVRLDSNSRVPEKEIRRAFGIEPGRPFDRGMVEEGVHRVYSMGQFQDVQYSKATDEEGDGIILHVKKKENLDNYYRFGVAIEDDLDGTSNFRLGTAYRSSRINEAGGYIDAEGEIGKTPTFYSELYQPFADGSQFFIAPAAKIGRGNLVLREGDDDIAEYERLEGSAIVRTGVEIDRLGEVAVGYRRGFGNLDLDIGDPALPEDSFDIGEVVTRVILDSLDTPDFPTEGYNFRFNYISSLEDVGASDDYNQMVALATIPYTFDRNTIIISGQVAETFDDLPAERSFGLGGFLNVSGYAQNELIASDYWQARTVYLRKFSEIKLPFTGFEFFAGASLEYASLSSDIDAIASEQITSGSIFLGADTPLIPAYLGVGVAESDEFAIYLVLGRISASGNVK